MIKYIVAALLIAAPAHAERVCKDFNDWVKHGGPEEMRIYPDPHACRWATCEEQHPEPKPRDCATYGKQKDACENWNAWDRSFHRDQINWCKYPPSYDVPDRTITVIIKRQ